MKCPKCGHVFKAENQAMGGKARWRGMTAKQRRKAASDAAKARWARRQNDKVSYHADNAGGAHGKDTNDK